MLITNATKVDYTVINVGNAYYYRKHVWYNILTGILITKTNVYDIFYDNRAVIYLIHMYNMFILRELTFVYRTRKIYIVKDAALLSTRRAFKFVITSHNTPFIV